MNQQKQAITAQVLPDAKVYCDHIVVVKPLKDSSPARALVCRAAPVTSADGWCAVNPFKKALQQALDALVHHQAQTRPIAQTSEAIEVAAATLALPDAAQNVNPTGEQLYATVKRQFPSGSFPWKMLSESGKSAWRRAAADLLLSPDTILARFATKPDPMGAEQSGQP